MCGMLPGQLAWATFFMSKIKNGGFFNHLGKNKKKFSFSKYGHVVYQKIANFTQKKKILIKKRLKMTSEGVGQKNILIITS